MKKERRVDGRRHGVCRRRGDRRNTNISVKINLSTVFRRREASRRDSANDKRVSASMV